MLRNAGPAPPVNDWGRGAARERAHSFCLLLASPPLTHMRSHALIDTHNTLTHVPSHTHMLVYTPPHTHTPSSFGG